MDDLPNLSGDERYIALISDLRKIHGELRSFDLVNNPAEIGNYLGRLRLGANLLFSFLNNFIDVLTELEQYVATKRQELYEAGIAEGKSPSAADSHSRNLTRVDEIRVKTIENRINQIKNEYERYNGICMYLQSRLKEFNTERIMG